MWNDFFNYYYSINMGKLHTLTHVRARGTQIHQSPLRRIEEETDPLAPGAGSKFSFFPACFFGWVVELCSLSAVLMRAGAFFIHRSLQVLTRADDSALIEVLTKFFWLQQKSHTQRFFKLHHSRVVGCCTTNQKVADWVKKNGARERKKISIRH